MSVVAVCGFAGSGKGTVSDILVEKHGYKKFAFADSVKDATAAIFGWNRALLEGDTKESREFRETIDDFWSYKLKKVVTPRWALQIMGTEAGRNVFGENIWLSSLEQKIQNIPNVVISDIRFPNEINFVRNTLCGRIIRIVRGKEPEWYSNAYYDNLEHGTLMRSYYPEVHYSEWAWIGTSFDFEIYNDSTVDALEVNVNYMLTSLKGPVKIHA